MSATAKHYLELISQHLQEHHAALFVGSGFSRNADKVTSDVPNIPLWDGLAKISEKSWEIPIRATLSHWLRVWKLRMVVVN